MEIHIGDRIADVSLISKDGNKVLLSIDGKPYPADIVMTENGTCSILYNGRSYNAELIRSAGGKSYQVNTRFSSYNVNIVDSQAKYLRMRKNNGEKQDDKIISPIPGKVVKIPVEEGDRLTAGDIAVVIEAMKMQSNYKVSSDCIIRRILVSEGDTINSNHILMTLDFLKGEENE